MQALVTWKDGKLITEAKPVEGSNGKATRVEREVVDGELIMVLTSYPLLSLNTQCILLQHVSYINTYLTSTCFHAISISTYCHTMYPNTLYPYNVFYLNKYQYNVSMQNTLPQQEFIWCIQVKHISIQCKYSTNVSYSTNTKIMYPTLLRTHKIYLNSTSKCKMHFVETSFHTSYPPQHLHLFIWQTLPQ